MIVCPTEVNHGLLEQAKLATKVMLVGSIDQSIKQVLGIHVAYKEVDVEEAIQSKQCTNGALIILPPEPSLKDICTTAFLCYRGSDRFKLGKKAPVYKVQLLKAWVDNKVVQSDQLVRLVKLMQGMSIPMQVGMVISWLEFGSSVYKGD